MNLRSILGDKSYLFTKLCSDGLGHQLMSFSQDPIGSAIRSANAITVWSGSIPRGQLIGQWSDILGWKRGVGGVSAVLSRHSLTPLGNTDQHLVLVADFPMGPVKITAGSPALPPTSHPHPHGPTDMSGRIKSYRSVAADCLYLAFIHCYRYNTIHAIVRKTEMEKLQFVLAGEAVMGIILSVK